MLARAVSLAAVLLAACPAAAQRPPELRFDPNRIEFATPWAQSSPCLADRTDPLCTAHAIVVCEALPSRLECRDFPWLARHAQAYSPRRVEYRVLALGFMSAAAVRRFDLATRNARHEPESDYAHIAPGNLQARVLRRQCAPESPDCSSANWDDLMIVVGRRRGVWEHFATKFFWGGFWLTD